MSYSVVSVVFVVAVELVIVVTSVIVWANVWLLVTTYHGVAKARNAAATRMTGITMAFTSGVTTAFYLWFTSCRLEEQMVCVSDVRTSFRRSL